MKYSMMIQWSDDDQLFLVTIPEFEGRVMQPCASGTTYDEAVKHGQEVIETYLELWQQDGIPFPEPRICEVA